MWYDSCVFYQIYPLGFCGAPQSGESRTEGQGEDCQNCGTQTGAGGRLREIANYLPYIERLGAGAVLFNPVFASSAHGYDTVDLMRIDSRLGTDDDFAELCGCIHSRGMKVVLDAVFNHVGRDFFAFRDVREKRESSEYKDWFFIDFGGNSAYNDGFFYQGWEGHYELVKLNLACRAVRDYLFSAVKLWVNKFGADGLRLDVCYLLPDDFLCELRAFCDSLKPEFYIVGEVIHGDPKRFIGGGKCNAVTNYECYKGLHSSLNSRNFFEIAHSLKRLFGNEPWAVCRGANPLNFADNHDVTRAMSSLANSRDIYALYAMLFCMPGTPCVYYGSEWGCEGRKESGDQILRPTIAAAREYGREDIFAYLQSLAQVKRSRKSLCCGTVSDVVLSNKYYAFERAHEGEKTVCAVSCDDSPVSLQIGRSVRVLAGECEVIDGGITLAPHSAAVVAVD